MGYYRFRKHDTMSRSGILISAQSSASNPPLSQLSSVRQPRVGELVQDRGKASSSAKGSVGALAQSGRMRIACRWECPEGVLAVSLYSASGLGADRRFGCCWSRRVLSSRAEVMSELNSRFNLKIYLLFSIASKRQFDQSRFPVLLGRWAA
jgi:hypothetical protein